MQASRIGRATLTVLAAVVSCELLTRAQQTQTAPLTPDIPASFTKPLAGYDYVKRTEMIPMRDGVKLFTVIMVPAGARNLPIALTRTPYNAAGRAARAESPMLRATLGVGDDIFAGGDYIRVYQDVRGKYGSEGEYVMTRPLRGPLNSSTVDHSTDAYDTIEWLVKNVRESNGKVGMIGSSYEGFTVVMALVNPHPALKVAAPLSPMVDGWMGDDWFHYGAFRQTNLDYYTGQLSARGGGSDIARVGYDDYQNFLDAGSAGDFAKAGGLDQLPWWRKVTEHPAYDQFWQAQALDKTMAAQPLTVPTLWLQGLWDQEDMWGAIHSYLAVEPKDRDNTKNFLVMGPWFHSQINREGFTLGPFRWAGDTTAEVRRDIIKPFFDQYLKDRAPTAKTPAVIIYNAGENHWDRFDRWPLACEKGCASTSKPIYLTMNGGLSFTTPTNALPAAATTTTTLSGGATNALTANAAFDDYISDPAKPVPFVPRPARFADSDQWRRWLVTDQRFVADRPDVLSYQTPALTESVRLGGAPLVNLVASTTGTDSDWVVKLIDVFPPTYPAQPELGGYQLAVAMDIFRGRYREGFETAKAIKADEPLPYRFTLPTVNHTFLPGHRIMVQVQSSWFPLYDRNPQKFVPNVFFAKPGDYVKAVQRVYHAAGAASFIDLPVVAAR